MPLLYLRIILIQTIKDQGLYYDHDGISYFLKLKPKGLEIKQRALARIAVVVVVEWIFIKSRVT